MQSCFFRTFCDFRTFVHKVFIMSCRNLQQKMTNKIIWSSMLKLLNVRCFLKRKLMQGYWLLNYSWDKAFKNGPSEIFGKQPLLKQTISLQFFKDCLPRILLGPFQNTLAQLPLLFIIQIFSTPVERAWLSGGGFKKDLKCVV